MYFVYIPKLHQGFPRFNKNKSMFCKVKKHTPEKQHFYALHEVNTSINCFVIPKRNAVKVRPVHSLEDPELLKLYLYILTLRGMCKHQMNRFILPLWISTDLENPQAAMGISV